jgi:hypothetical protein
MGTGYMKLWKNEKYYVMINQVVKESATCSMLFRKKKCI